MSVSSQLKTESTNLILRGVYETECFYYVFKSCFFLVEVSTQGADGWAAIFKGVVGDKRGILRSLAKFFVKEYQWRYNHRNKDL